MKAEPKVGFSNHLGSYSRWLSTQTLGGEHEYDADIGTMATYHINYLEAVFENLKKQVYA